MRRSFRTATTILVRPLVRAVLALAAAQAGGSAAASTINDELPQFFVMSPTGVNLQSGGFVYSNTDLAVGPLKLVRSWGAVQSFGTNVTGAYDHHGFGLWNHNYGWGVVAFSNSSTSRGMNVYVEGQRLLFVYSSTSGTWLPWNTETQGWQLTPNGSGYVLTSRGGDVYYFAVYAAASTGWLSTPQLIEHVDYADGRRLDFAYNSSALLRRVTSNSGYALVLDYGANNRIAAVCGLNTANQYVDANTTCQGAALKASYGYAASSVGDRLTSVTDAASQLTSFSYGPDGNTSSSRLLTCVTLTGSPTCAISNVYGDGVAANWNQVMRQTTATGQVWTFAFDFSVAGDPPLQPGEVRYTTGMMTDPAGNNTITQYANHAPNAVTTPSGGTVTYAFLSLEPRQFTYPEGNTTLIDRDDRQNVIKKTLKAKPNSGLADLVWTATYPSDNGVYSAGCIAASQTLCNKPSSMVDPKGNQTDFSYDPATGLVLKETLPAPSPGAARPETRYSYVQRSAWVRNAGGGYSPAAAPVWLLASKSFCKAGAAAASGTGCANGASDEVVTTNDYGPDSGPNNLLLRGTVVDAGGLSLRTCYGYDWQGSKLSETKPRAGLTVCP